MTERKPAKSQADRAREYRERHKSQSVDNPVTRDEIVTLFVTFRDAIRDEIVTHIDAKMSEIVTVLRDSSTPDPPLEGVLGVETTIPSRNEKSDASRNVTEEPSRQWTNSFTTRPGEIPRCPDCDHLIVNCHCETDWVKPDNGFHPSQLRQDLQ